MNFSDKPFSERLKVMGDIAQGAFEEWATESNLSFVRYGFDRPPFTQFWKLPLFVRATPDYVCETNTNNHFFVEVKGARGRYLKLKCETMNALEPWNNLRTVWFFIYRNDTEKFSFVPYRRLLDVCEKATIKYFSQDKKPYYELRTNTFEWKGLRNDKESIA